MKKQSKIIIMKKIIKYIYQKYSQNLIDYEYLKISKNLKKINELSFSLLEVGSGLCHFITYLRTNFLNAEIRAIDINPDLVEYAKHLNFDCQQASVIKLPYNDNCFDVVHCSHVIEHLKYPEIVIALDELFRVVKFGGEVIIRAPMVATNGFWDDIDHIRPYPPKALLNYFNNLQQQKKGNNCSYKLKDIWYLRGALLLETNFIRNRLISCINLLSIISWNIFRFPFSKAYNYGIVLEKIH